MHQTAVQCECTCLGVQEDHVSTNVLCLLCDALTWRCVTDMCGGCVIVD